MAYRFRDRPEEIQVRRIVFVGMILGVVAMSGCKIDSNKQGDNENVKIATPFGGMQVKTNESDAISGIGLPIYPGAEFVKKNDKDKGAADVNLSFGSFQLRVKAANYSTPDAPDKVSAFYRAALARYGDVIQCENNKPVGSPTRTADGLTCDNDKGNHMSANQDALSKMELKAGSKQHQHIIAVDSEGTGTKFVLIVLDLPGHISVGEDDKQ